MAPRTPSRSPHTPSAPTATSMPGTPSPSAARVRDHLGSVSYSGGAKSPAMLTTHVFPAFTALEEECQWGVNEARAFSRGR